MNLTRRIAWIFLCVLISAACRQKKEISSAASLAEQQIYHGSETLHFDLIHTQLLLKPDFSKREMQGTAYITLKPHFYPQDTLVLDAKYMHIHSVRITGNMHEITDYIYDSLKLRIPLDRTYSKTDTLKVEIVYTARPEQVPSAGSSAIKMRKGLYFINHDGRIKDKPVQLWTQGETESASCWFPTLDAPNQKSTQDLQVTLPTGMISISNGRFAGSVMHGDTLRTDRWVQTLPHAPYLFALVAGEFAEYRDTWRGKPVHYYVEPSYQPYAKLIFGNTPEMMDFFSMQLGVEYPWDKYHQVVVRDFVSGAMENTGAVIHYDALQQDARELLDETHESIVAHELFHHWFGNLVTCESWSNLPLNESFATYGEYLWSDYKYGRDESDVVLAQMLDQYLNEATYKQENLVRYDYPEREEMFDAHSYQKGALVLHMLRKITGDEAFFAALNLYLNRHRFGTAEISDLRKAFEDVTGKDLNWFFNQWFFNSGQPSLNIIHSQKNGDYEVMIIRSGGAFRLQTEIEWTGKSGTQRKPVVIDGDTTIIRLSGIEQSAPVLFDPEIQLLCTKSETKSRALWMLQLAKANRAAHRVQAFEQIAESRTSSTAFDQEFRDACFRMLRDSFRTCRMKALEYMYEGNMPQQYLDEFADTVKDKLISDRSPLVRATGVRLLYATGDEGSMVRMLSDSSFTVVRSALHNLGRLNKAKAFKFADSMRENQHRKMQSVIYYTIARNTPGDEVTFFTEKIRSGSEHTIRNASNALSAYLIYNRTDQIETALSGLIQMAGNKETNAAAASAFKTMHAYAYYQVFILQIRMERDKKNRDSYNQSLNAAKRLYKKLDDLLDRYPAD